MDEEELFKYEETRLDGAIRWQKRALAAEGKVAELESTVSERNESIDKLIERASGYGRKAIDLETERNRLSGRVAELEGERRDCLLEMQDACEVLPDSPIAGYRAVLRCVEVECDRAMKAEREVVDLRKALRRAGQSGKGGSDA